jgi:hypothetical protein
MTTDLTQYFKDGYKLKIEHYLLVNDEGDELVIQIDHKKINALPSLIDQLRRSKPIDETKTLIGQLKSNATA